MPCINCNNCIEATPIISPCTDVVVRFGYSAAAVTAYILEFEKQSGVKRQVAITSGAANEVTIDFNTLTGFDDFFTKPAGPYLVRLRDTLGALTNLNDQAGLPAARDTECILVSFDNVTENAAITAINLVYDV